MALAPPRATRPGDRLRRLLLRDQAEGVATARGDHVDVAILRPGVAWQGSEPAQGVKDLPQQAHGRGRIRHVEALGLGRPAYPVL